MDTMIYLTSEVHEANPGEPNNVSFTIIVARGDASMQPLQKIFASRNTSRLLIRPTSPVYYHTRYDVAQPTSGAT
ncbi:hypothetical protein Y032_0085g1814 [Ancylostoma ceylanicum]|uniref:Uncharacterized protein n=1 Tax=Ancylostoma ceylanicum TaxID=53326 RepID=A0A016TPW4_9BILA|nr:hypothetical protein Y032_0085g1814 [Ancylostoma ceylanicum]